MFYLLLLCVWSYLSAETHFLLYDLQKEEVVMEEGDCDQRFSPCSTFKIPLSLIGYDTGILLDEQTPEWPYDENELAPYLIWRCAQTPATWMRVSCIWFSRRMTQMLGMDVLQSYISLFHYGNGDLTGNPGKADGLTRSWLSSSLTISPREQIFFLKKLLIGQLSVSAHAYTMTKQLLFHEERNGWKLFGKTGTGEQQDGWFIGWLEQDEHIYIFALHVQNEQRGELYGGRLARAILEENLFSILNTR